MIWTMHKDCYKHKKDFIRDIIHTHKPGAGVHEKFGRFSYYS